MRVIGTAGHVDHGKSTLVQRLTGIDPDRLREEKARGLTIDLGFAWLTLPDGETLGIVDVPGHRDFIENMLAGVGGIDAAVLVIAADEGIMPQTREHLAILDLLGIQTGIIVLSKIDLIDDEEWLDLVELEVQEAVSNTILAEAPILPISAHSGQGIDNLINTLTDLLSDLPPRTDYNQPRLPIDRVFTIDGFGTVVTGTLSGGTLAIGDTVEIQPSSHLGRVRGLQSYKQDVEVALPGSRVAVNVSGIDKNKIERGQVLAFPGQLSPTRLIDVHFRHLADADRPLKHNAEVKFFSGASETIANVRLLNAEQLLPDESGWLQLRLRDAIPLTNRDRFILRYPSPPQTIGGGLIVNAHPEKRWKRFQATVIDDLQTRLEGSPAERVTQVADNDSPVKRPNIQKVTGYTDSELHAALEEAIAQNRLIHLPDNTYLATSRYQAYLAQIESILQDYHQKIPLRLGIPREELRSRLGVKNAFLTMLLDSEQRFEALHNLVKMREHEIAFSPKQQTTIETLLQAMSKEPYTPPSFTDASQITGEDVLYALIDLGEIVLVQSEIIFSRKAYDDMVIGVLAMIDNNGTVDVKGVRDKFGSSRKYAIGLLEHLDAKGITKRVDDERVRGRNAP
ncbi:MAG: selenocysteine-specific translation elongation factor [Anaerolineae bacterium]|nr:selenocysteine-specific translation elongation factor [Anaerolineae bacterium]